MKVKIEIEFEVESLEDEEIDEQSAKWGAQLAAYHNLSLINWMGGMEEFAEHHVDGFGKVKISLEENL